MNINRLIGYFVTFLSCLLRYYLKVGHECSLLHSFMSAFNVVRPIDAITDKFLKLPLNKLQINRKILIYKTVGEIM